MKKVIASVTKFDLLFSAWSCRRLRSLSFPRLRLAAASKNEQHADHEHQQLAERTSALLRGVRMGILLPHHSRGYLHSRRGLPLSYGWR